MPNVRLFEIEFDSADCVYYPGNLLTGSVILDLDEPLTMRCLRLTFDGRAHVEWETIQNETNLNIYSTVVVRLSDKQIYFEHTVNLYGDDRSSICDNKTVVMPKGKHTFPFEYSIPDDYYLPGSFEGKYGYIGYTVKAHIKRPAFSSDIQIKKEFFIPMPVYDLNLDPVAQQPQVVGRRRKVCCWCCAKGRIICKAKLPKTGYVNGELVSATAEIINRSFKTVKKVSMRLMQTITYKCYPGTKDEQYRDEKFCLAELTKTEPIRPGRTQYWINEGFLVPPQSIVSPTLNDSECSVIQRTYQIVFEIVATGCSSSFEARLPVIIGTVPLNTSSSSGSTS